jgi:Leucine-rich repeat (LRR) protein
MNDSLETIVQIRSLKELKLSDNALSGELNAAIEGLGDLEVLELQGNKLSTLPAELRSLVNLRVLNISHNQITALPMAEICQLPLVQLFASKNKLSGTFFTNNGAEMSRLQMLDVSINSLQSLSVESLTLPSIKELNIAFNRLSSLPEVAGWTELVSLFAEDNKISEIPRGFTGLLQLRTADFTGNDFQRLDPKIGTMNSLETIKFAANPIRERKFLTMGTADLKRDLLARLGLDEPGQEVD